MTKIYKTHSNLLRIQDKIITFVEGFNYPDDTIGKVKREKEIFNADYFITIEIKMTKKKIKELSKKVDGK